MGNELLEKLVQESVQAVADEVEARRKMRNKLKAVRQSERPQGRGRVHSRTKRYGKSGKTS